MALTILSLIPWWLYLAVAILVLWPFIKRLGERGAERRRFERAGLADVQRMHWRDFERYLADLFQRMGYQVELTPPSGDMGVDLILTDGRGQRIAVQAKLWKDRVGSPEVQRSVGGAVYHRCQQVIVVTTSGYTEQAREFARGTGTQLWGLKELGDAMERARSGAGQVAVGAGALPRVGAKVVATPVARVAAGPSCPICGAAMVERAVRGRRVWLCSRFPGCRGYGFRE